MKPLDLPMIHVSKPGAWGPSVRRIQAALNSAGANPQLEVSGEYGPATEAAVREFQARRGLPVDGAAARPTLSALGM